MYKRQGISRPEARHVEMVRAFAHFLVRREGDLHRAMGRAALQELACHPLDVKHYDTQRLRSSFMMSKVMAPDEINVTYTLYDLSLIHI